MNVNTISVFIIVHYALPQKTSLKFLVSYCQICVYIPRISKYCYCPGQPETTAMAAEPPIMSFSSSSTHLTGELGKLYVTSGV